MSGLLGSFGIDYGTAQVDIDNYLPLITSEHADKPNFIATVTVSAQPFIDGQNLLYGMPQLYDVDIAVGQQLDVVGQWVGVTRYVAQEITGVYFAWDTASLGWEQGVWQGPFDPSTGLVQLDDGTYRILIKARIIANHWDGTVAGAMPALAELFTGSATPGTLLFIQDNLDMSMSFVVAGEWPTALFFAILSQGELGIKPGAVRVNYLKTSIDGTAVFGFDVENSYVSGWDVGSWAIPV